MFKSCNAERPAIAASVADSELPLINDEVIAAVDFIELRIDYFKDISVSYVRDVFISAARFNIPLIATFRAASEGGNREVADSERLRVIEAIIELTQIVDVEINSSAFHEFKAIVHSAHKTLLGSFHNFQCTPDEDTLVSIFHKAKEKGADLVKVATMADTSEEFIRLVRFTLRYPWKVVTLAMGKMALRSRVLLPFVGSCFTYGATGQPKAPGQTDVVRLRELINSVA